MRSKSQNRQRKQKQHTIEFQESEKDLKTPSRAMQAYYNLKSSLEERSDHDSTTRPNNQRRRFESMLSMTYEAGFQKQNKKMSRSQAEAVYDRMMRFEQQKEEKLTRLKMKKMELDSEIYTHHPKINRSKVAAMGEEGHDHSLLGRVDEIIVQRQKKIQDNKMKEIQRRERKLQKDCTFTPDINMNKKYRHAMDRSVQDLLDWKKLKAEKLMITKLKQEAEYNQRNSFTPKILNKSRILMKSRRLSSKKKKVEVRLYELSKKRNQRLTTLSKSPAYAKKGSKGQKHASRTRTKNPRTSRRKKKNKAKIAATGHNSKSRNPKRSRSLKNKQGALPARDPQIMALRESADPRMISNALENPNWRPRTPKPRRRSRKRRAGQDPTGRTPTRENSKEDSQKRTMEATLDSKDTRIFENSFDRKSLESFKNNTVSSAVFLKNCEIDEKKKNHRRKKRRKPDLLRTIGAAGEAANSLKDLNQLNNGLKNANNDLSDPARVRPSHNNSPNFMVKLKNEDQDKSSSKHQFGYQNSLALYREKIMDSHSSCSYSDKPPLSQNLRVSGKLSEFKLMKGDDRHRLEQLEMIQSSKENIDLNSALGALNQIRDNWGKTNPKSGKNGGKKGPRRRSRSRKFQKKGRNGSRGRNQPGGPLKEKKGAKGAQQAPEKRRQPFGVRETRYDHVSNIISTVANIKTPREFMDGESHFGEENGKNYIIVDGGVKIYYKDSALSDLINVNMRQKMAL